jgi:heme exporter protein C
MTGLHPGSIPVNPNEEQVSPVINFKMNANMQLIFYLSLTGFTILYFWMWRLGYKSIILTAKSLLRDQNKQL